MPDGNELAHVTGWEPYNLPMIYVGQVSWVGSVLMMMVMVIMMMTTI